MVSSFALLAGFSALMTGVLAQECTKSSYDGSFQLNPVRISAPAKGSIQSRQSSCDAKNALVTELHDGVLKDSQGRTGSIVANYQFQYDGPPQPDALETSGFTICGNNTLASKGNAVWYQCSDNTRTSIYGPNLTPIGAACYQVYYEIVPCSGKGGQSSGGSVSTLPDGQPTVTSSTCVPVTTMQDGQPVVSSCPPATKPCVPITTMQDGQPVVSSCPSVPATSKSVCVPITTMSDGQPVVSSCPSKPSVPATSQCVPITTMSDGQPVVSSCPSKPSVPVTSKCVPITTMADGQPVVSSCPSTPSVPATSSSAPCLPITTLSDGQPVVGACSNGSQVRTTLVPSSSLVVGQASTGGVMPTAANPSLITVNFATSLQSGYFGGILAAALAVLLL